MLELLMKLIFGSTGAEQQGNNQSQYDDSEEEDEEEQNQDVDYEPKSLTLGLSNIGLGQER